MVDRTEQPIGEKGAERARQPYEAPTLIDYGPVEDLTRGTFAGVGADFGIYS